MSRSHRYAIVIAFILLALTYWRVATYLRADVVDDTYIFLRYARNLVRGHGLVFNPGEYVEGYTSPFWVFYLAGLGKLGVDLVQGCKASGALLGLATVLILLYLGFRSVPGSPLLATIPAWFLVTNPSFIYWTWSGMDTALFTCLFLASLVVFVGQLSAPRGAMFLSGALFAAAVFARLEMLSVLPVYLGFILWANRGQRQMLLAKSASFLAPMLLLLVHWAWRYSYYGSLVPNTFYAKVGLPGPTIWLSGLRYGAAFVQAYAPWLAAALVAWIVMRRARETPPLEWTFALAVAVAWAAYVTSVGGDHFAMFRFYVPILPLVAFLTLPLLARLDHWPASRSNLAFVPLVTLVLVLNVLVFVLHGGPRAVREVGMADRWVNVGLWFEQNVPAGARVAAQVVGAVPYYSDLVTYDLLGLTDREVATRGRTYPAARVGHQKYHTDYILSREPDYIIFPGSGLFDSPQYQEPDRLDLEYGYAVYDLLHDERTAALYEYRSVYIAGGWCVEFLQRRERGTGGM